MFKKHTNLWSLEVTQRLASIGVRGNSVSHSPWIVRRVTKVKITIRRMFKFIFPIKAERK
ncbi:hypothetical protein Lepto1489_07685 [Leptospira interrogans serovar Bataviae]|uniref:Uncharacterized protein n=1 Tax=Leptospira interrogans serovar Bataviae TaxID=312175 RepID=A0AAP9WIV0_LEPIR|nr:hypothetical protein Lepto1548_07890 [Leptospira interrogans serovar Bataviae]QOI50336.1 hypothetical protein Lepto1489_07685 [Leptospira interrogans serovar Bataviae]